MRSTRSTTDDRDVGYDTGELEEKTLEHQGETVREFYSALPGPILVGIEATGSMQWFLE
jgi:hypothetical protein